LYYLNILIYDLEVYKMAIIVNKHRCPGNHSCPAVRVCPVNAIIQDGFKAPVIDEKKCINCKKCVMFCPMGAIQQA
jgi:Fe-S-cluster-containing hydrogenase component 2